MHVTCPFLVGLQSALQRRDIPLAGEKQKIIHLRALRYGGQADGRGINNS